LFNTPTQIEQNKSPALTNDSFPELESELSALGSPHIPYHSLIVSDKHGVRQSLFSGSNAGVLGSGTTGSTR